ncbi:pyridoxal phosphate-dependent aminotransferase [Aquimarina hainanensis]|uniref:Aminotransferase n=1 Tax=Aquimarina hainanensis TaxID=1578017 RepID=A0ABW5NBE5_9FLAO
MIYGHGDDRYRYNINFKANFSSNVWHAGTSKALLTYLSLQLPSIGNYPSPGADELATIIAKHHEVTSDQVLITNGATEAFYLIANAFSGMHAAILSPTFSEYEDACQANKVTVRHYLRSAILQESFNEEIAFICNPNNPDGYSNTPAEIATLLEKYPATTFVIDEAYIDFSLSIQSCISLIEKYDNLIIVRSLTKVFSIPGIRLGYLLSSSSLKNKIEQVKMPWSVNTIAIEAGKYIYANYNTLYPPISDVLDNCLDLQRQIQQLNGFSVHPSSTNYFLVKMNTPQVKALKEYLIFKHQILIRDASNFKGLDAHYFRVASQDTSKNQLLINALRQWISYTS